MTTSSLNVGVPNSKGVFAEHRLTLADESTVIMGPNSSGWAQRTGWHLAAIEAEALADEAISKVKMGADPVDFEGVPKKVAPIVASGIAVSPVYDSFTAGREDGKQSTGHATPPSPQGRFGPAPMNLFLRPGPAS